MPLSDQAIVQVATGSTGGTDASTTFVSFPTPAQAGNSVLIMSTTNFVSTTDYVQPDQSTHPLPSELYPFSASPILKPNTPRIVSHGVYLQADTSSWEFDWVNLTPAAQPVGVAWLAVELAGLIPQSNAGQLHPNEVEGYMNWWYDGGTVTVADSADNIFNPSVYEAFMMVGFAAWVPSSRPPAAVSFAESTDTTWGGWTPLAPNVRTTNAATPNVGLDVAYKITYGGGTFSCQATYGQAPGGIGLLKDVWASDAIGSQRVRSSLTAQVMSG